MTSRLRLRSRTGLVLVLASSGAGVAGLALPVLAQQAGGGTTLRFDTSTELRQNDNLGLDPTSQGDSTIWDTRLGFALGSQTRNSDLTLSGSGVLRAAEFPDGSDSGFEDPRLQLSYKRSSARSALSFGANWEQADLRFLDPISDPIRLEGGSSADQQDLGTVSGTRTVTGYRMSYETGIDTPLGFSLGGSHREVTYADTSDADYYDNTDDRLNAGLRLDLSSVLTGTVSASAGHYEAENEDRTIRDRRDLSFGLSQELGGDTLSGRLGYGTVDETEGPSGARSTDRTSGMTGGLTYTRGLTNGTLALDYEHSVETSGGRDTVSVARALELPDGSLSARVGLSQGDSGSPSVIGDIAWAQDTARGRRTLSLGRSVRTNDSDEDVVVTRLAFGWTHSLNEANGVALTASYASIEKAGSGTASSDVSESQRGNVSLAWTRELTQDVEMALGYEHRWLDQTDEGLADSNAVFLRLGRSFTFRP